MMPVFLLNDELISCEQINREQISYEYFCFLLRDAGLEHYVQIHARFARGANELLLLPNDHDAEIFNCAIRIRDALRGLESQLFVPQWQLANHRMGCGLGCVLLDDALLLNEPISLISECSFDYSGVSIQHAFLSLQSLELQIVIQQVLQHSLALF